MIGPGSDKKQSKTILYDLWDTAIWRWNFSITIWGLLTGLYKCLKSMEPRRSDTQLQVTKGFHLEKNQPRTGQGVKEARGSWDVTWRVGLFGRSADSTKAWKGILSTWFIQQNCWIGWDDKNTRNLSWPELTYGIQEEQRRFNLIGKVKKYSINRLQYKHTANSSIMRPKTKHAIQI